jgi:membrane fusion protein, multidrug efflux system
VISKGKILPLVIIGTIILFLVVVKVWNFGERRASSPGADRGPAPVEVFIAGTDLVEEWITSTGTVLGNREIELRSEISGRITDLFFVDGSQVNKGDLLIKISDDQWQAELKKLQLQRELAEIQEGRLRELLKIDGISRQEYEVAKTQVQLLSAEIELVRSHISKTEIRAPFSGMVGLRQVSEGAMVGPGNVIASLQEIKIVRIDFSVPEKYLGDLNQKGEIYFRTAGTHVEHTAMLVAIEPKVDVQSRTVKVRARYNNQNMDVLPGAFAEVRMVVRKFERSIMIPSEAIIPEFRGQKVFLVKSGKIAQQPIVTGIRNDSTTQVLSGLSKGDTVVVTGIMQLRPESEVKIVNVRQPIDQK